MRMDGTVTETNIAFPMESHMLVDALRVVSRHVHWLSGMELKLATPFSLRATPHG